MLNYIVTLTGAPDSTTDFDLKLKSYNGTHYSGFISNLSFQVPRISGYIDEILNRTNGELILKRNSVELFRGLLKRFDFFVGPKTSTLSLSASYLETETTLKTETPDVTSVNFGYDLKRTFTANGFANVQPLDSIIYEEETIQIDKVVINISKNGIYYRLREL